MAMSADVDLRTTIQGSASAPAYPEEGVYKNVIMSAKVDVPALIAAGVLTAAGGLILTGGTYRYKLFSLPKYTIVRGAWVTIRTIETTGATGTITVYVNATAITSTHATTTAGAILSTGWATGSTPLAFNTGIGTDFISAVILTASLFECIFDVNVDCIVGKQAYNAGSLAGSTGQ